MTLVSVWLQNGHFTSFYVPDPRGYGKPQHGAANDRLTLTRASLKLNHMIFGKLLGKTSAQPPTQSPDEHWVLIVDDDPDIRELIEFDFESAGYHAKVAGSAQEAIEKMSEVRFDAIVSDVRMPDAGGVELLKEIGKLTPETKPVFIFITGFADISEQEAYHLGVDGFVMKPFGRRAVVDLARRLLLSPAQRWAGGAEVSGHAWSFHFKSLEEARSLKHFNVGRGGAFVRHLGPEYPALGSEIAFWIQWDEPYASAAGPVPRIEGKAKVRWVRKEGNSEGLAPGMGLEFLNLTGPSIRMLTELQKNHPSMSFIPRT